MARQSSPGRGSGERIEGALRFSRLNWILLTLGIACVIVGYVLLADGSTVAAPLLLVLGYVVLIPLGIMA